MKDYEQEDSKKAMNNVKIDYRIDNDRESSEQRELRLFKPGLKEYTRRAVNS